MGHRVDADAAEHDGEDVERDGHLRDEHRIVGQRGRNAGQLGQPWSRYTSSPAMSTSTRPNSTTVVREMARRTSSTA